MKTKLLALAILTLCGMIFPAAVHADPDTPFPTLGDQAYGNLPDDQKVNYIAQVVDNGRQAKMALGIANGDLSGLQDQRALVASARAANASAGLSTAEADRKMQDLDNKIADKQKDIDKLQAKVDAMSAESLKRRAQDPNLHKKGMQLQQQWEKGTGPSTGGNGNPDRPLGNGVTLLGQEAGAAPEPKK